MYDSAIMAGVGIYSGTFDPVHNGHIAFCLEALKVCGLDKVWLLPEPKPRGKQHVSDFAHRKAMLQLAILGQPKLEIVTPQTNQFTIEQTLPELQRLAGTTELTMLIGSDVVRTLTYRWPGLSMLLGTVSFAIASRAGDTKEEIESILANLGHPVRYQWITTPYSHAASSRARREGGQLLLHPLVRRYSADNGLYGDGMK